MTEEQEGYININDKPKVTYLDGCEPTDAEISSMQYREQVQEFYKDVTTLAKNAKKLKDLRESNALNLYYNNGVILDAAKTEQAKLCDELRIAVSMIEIRMNIIHKYELSQLIKE